MSRVETLPSSGEAWVSKFTAYPPEKGASSQDLFTALNSAAAERNPPGAYLALPLGEGGYCVYTVATETEEDLFGLIATLAEGRPGARCFVWHATDSAR